MVRCSLASASEYHKFPAYFAPMIKLLLGDGFQVREKFPVTPVLFDPNLYEDEPLFSLYVKPIGTPWRIVDFAVRLPISDEVKSE